MSATVRLFPHPVSLLLEARLSSFADPNSRDPLDVQMSLADGTRDVSDDTPEEYDVSACSWELLTFRIDAGLPSAELERIREVGTDPPRAIATLLCHATKYRHSVDLGYVGDGQWTGYATLSKSDVRLTTELRAALVTRERALSTAPRVVAIARLIRIVTDSQERRTAASSGFNVRWDDFANSSDHWRSSHPSDLFHLEPYGDEPVLWLNTRYSTLRDLFDSHAKRGPEAALRDLVGTTIAQTAWVQLLFAAVGALAYDEDSGEATFPTSHWQLSLLKVCAAQIYPSEVNEEAALRRLAMDSSYPAGRAGLASRLGSVAQDLSGTFRVAEKTIRAFESVRDNTEGPEE